MLQHKKKWGTSAANGKYPFFILRAMGDLFSNSDIPVAKQEKRKGNPFKACNGKFTNQKTAFIDGLKKDIQRFKLGYEHYKRLAERLSEDFKTEHERVLELKEKLRKYES